MRLFCITIGRDSVHNREVYDFLKASAEVRGVEWVDVEVNKIAMDDLFEMGVRAGDMMYGVSIGDPRVKMAEFILRERGVCDLRGVPRLSCLWGDLLRMKMGGVPIIPMVIGVSEDAEKIREDVEGLGGFPVVIKMTGMSHGAGVKKADSMEELEEVMAGIDREKVVPVMKKFLVNARHVRCVVLGDRVVDAIEYFMPEDDFRTNVTNQPIVRKFGGDEEVFDVAARAVVVAGMEFGGVDILIDEDGGKYVAEVNYPCNFARNQMCTGADISGMVVDYLISKVS